MSHKIKAWVSVGLTISMMILLLSPLQRVVAAEENTEKASEEISISMDAFCALDSDEQEGRLVDVASVEDLDKLRTYLSENPTGGANTFRQTTDIVVSPYTYEYLEDLHRIEISYDGAVEAYYDVTDGNYYAGQEDTNKLDDYQWKVKSWEPIGTAPKSYKKVTWRYLGEGHTIEGVYQKMDITEMVHGEEYLTGIFSYASEIKGVHIKNFFAQGGRYAAQAVLGNHLGNVYDCTGEAVQIMAFAMAGDAHPSVGFISTPQGNIENVQVDSNIFVRDVASADQEPTFPVGGYIGGIVDWISDSGKNQDIRDCQSSGRIWNINGTGFAYGGIAGCIEGAKGNKVLRCNSDMQIEGEILFAGGIAGTLNSRGGMTVECTYEGDLFIHRSHDNQTEYMYAYPCVGGICGQLALEVMVFGCRNKAEIKSETGNAGGIVGITNDGGVVSCANYGNVETQEGKDPLCAQPAGGIVGSYGDGDETLIVNCYNAGNISSGNSVASGIVGLLNNPWNTCPEQFAMNIQNVCSTGTVTGAVEKDYLTGIINEGVVRAYDGRTADPAWLCAQLNKSLLREDVEGGYEWTDMESFWLNNTYGYDPVYHNYPQTGQCLRAKWATTDDGALDLQVVQEKDLDVIDYIFKPTASPTVKPTSKPSVTQKPKQTVNTPKKTKWKAPTFSLKRKKTHSGQRYILLTMRKYQGTNAEVWVKIGTGRYRKIKLSQNKVKKLHGKLKFRYSFKRKTLYFKVRTYQKKNGKKIYSAKSKGKRIVAK